MHQVYLPSVPATFFVYVARDHYLIFELLSVQTTRVRGVLLILIVSNLLSLLMFCACAI